MKTLVEVVEHTGTGYRPLIEFQEWCVALINDGPDFQRENITFMEAHDETDEVFVLLSGRCILFIGDGDSTVGEISAIRLAPNKLYNVKKSTWHNLITCPGTRVLIVENATTSRKNSRYLPVAPDQLPQEGF